MPFLTVYVDDQPVVLDLHEDDDLSAIACELEAQNFQVNPAFPTVTVGEKDISSDIFSRVDFQATYKFGKLFCSFSLNEFDSFFQLPQPLLLLH